METKIRILHVDDNVFDRQLVHDALEVEHDEFAVIGAAARHEFEAQLVKGDFDLILTDFNILGFEGLQVIDAVHQKHPDLPVIVLTGTGSEEIAVEAMKRGATDYVIKNPHHIRRLPMAIQAAIETKQLREKRIQSEQALRAFAEALPDLSFVIDEDGHIIQFLNAPEHLLYLPVEEQLGHSVYEVFPKKIADQIVETVQQTVKTGDIQTVEYQLEMEAGKMWFEARTSLIRFVSDQKRLVIYVARDVTDRKETELKLRQERNLLRTLIDNVPDYIFVKDREGRFSVSNIAHAATAHLSPKQMIGRTGQNVFAPTLAQMFHADDEHVMTTGEALVNQERFVLDAEGKKQWILITKVPLHNEAQQIIGLVGIARNITARKYAEEALRASEEYLRAVIADTPIILFVFDKDGILTLLQGQGLSLFAADPSLYLGKSIWEAFDEFIPDIQERFQQALIGEETASIQTIGDVIFDVRYSPMRNKIGEISGIIGVATDITERLKSERLQMQLEKEQEIIVLKERFISTASHDFRTPLAIIKMSTNLLQSHLDQMPSEQRLAKLHQIIKQVDNMTQLMDDILTMSRANAGKLDFKPEPTDLRAFCKQIWTNFQCIAETTHTFDFRFHCAPEEVILDPNLVHYILVNLLSNAIKYSQEEGKVSFEVSCDSETLIFRVRDNGIGIPVEDQPKLFEPFHRATNTSGIEGTGLGLSIVKSYVEVHQGRIEFESSEGQGTTFIVYIPLILQQ